MSGRVAVLTLDEAARVWNRHVLSSENLVASWSVREVLQAELIECPPSTSCTNNTSYLRWGLRNQDEVTVGLW